MRTKISGFIVYSRQAYMGLSAIQTRYGIGYHEMPVSRASLSMLLDTVHMTTPVHMCSWWHTYACCACVMNKRSASKHDRLVAQGLRILTCIWGWVFICNSTIRNTDITAHYMSRSLESLYLLTSIWLYIWNVGLRLALRLQLRHLVHLLHADWLYAEVRADLQLKWVS